MECEGTVLLMCHQPREHRKKLLIIKQVVIQDGNRYYHFTILRKDSLVLLAGERRYTPRGMMGEHQGEVPFVLKLSFLPRLNHAWISKMD